MPTIYKKRPKEQTSSNAWDYATEQYGRVINLVYLSGCRQPGFWSARIVGQGPVMFTNLEVINWLETKK